MPLKSSQRWHSSGFSDAFQGTKHVYGRSPLLIAANKVYKKYCPLCKDFTPHKLQMEHRTAHGIERHYSCQYCKLLALRTALEQEGEM